MEFTAQHAVPQELVVTVIVGLLHPRPVLVKIDGRTREVEAQIESITRSLTTSSKTVICTPNVTWEELVPYFKSSPGSSLILDRVNRLSKKTQLELGYALITPGPELREFLRTSALIFTTTEPLDGMNPFLRRQILLKQDTRAIDVDSVLVEPPRRAKDSAAELQRLHRDIIKVEIVPELLRYMQDIMIFLRTNRFAFVGVRPQATTDFELLVRTLCALRDSPIATPVTIKDAARLTLPIHLHMVNPEDEPSLQYGGDHALVKQWIKEWDAEVLIDYVVEQVPVPR